MGAMLTPTVKHTTTARLRHNSDATGINAIVNLGIQDLQKSVTSRLAEQTQCAIFSSLCIGIKIAIWHANCELFHNTTYSPDYR